MKLFETKNNWKDLRAIDTAQEIEQQADLWKTVYQLVKKQAPAIKSFLNQFAVLDNGVVILTGAGTSAFIGKTQAGYFQQQTGWTTRAIPTTDLVTHPTYFIKKQQATLLISYARSGDSPESLASLNLVNEHADRVFHLIITCNSNGHLAKGVEKKQNQYLLLLPEACNDKGLAMTSSFTCMLLAGLLVADINQLEEKEKVVQHLSQIGKTIFSQSKSIHSLSTTLFERAVFLGSGSMAGIAEEAGLKLQELTNGTIICKHDSYLGFRHGPKAVINDKTLIVYFLSNEEAIQQYEIDLIYSVAEKKLGMKCVIVGHPLFDIPESVYVFPNLDAKRIASPYLGVSLILFAQILSFYKAIDLGFSPDTPSKNGAISRVVKGVTIY